MVASIPQPHRPAMSDTSAASASPATAPAPRTPPAAESDADRRSRERVQQLLARPPAAGSGSIELGGRSMAYSTQVAFLPVAAEGFAGASGDPQAAVMTISYLLNGAPPAERPVMFAFNGGPGSASIWLHVGALGPKRVVVPDDGSMAPPPYAVADNPHSWFEHFDLVFIDPPHTGWSCTASEAARKKALSVDGDIDALTEVIRVWLTRHRRWGSPLYLAGESYGTTRGAGIADKLQSLGAPLSGLVLISCAMDLQSLVFAPGNDLPYALFLPGFAAVGQYHGLVQGTPEAARDAAEAYVDEYVAALHAGARLTSQQRARVARRVAALTGLPQALVEEQNLRIGDRTYFVEALRSKGLVVGRLDARATAPAAAQRGHEMEFDPGIEAIGGAYTMATLDYFASALNIEEEQRYEVLSYDTHKAWNWNRGDSSRGGFTSTSPDLARVLRRNAQLRVFVASGRYDLGTPYSASDWSLAHLDVPADVLQRVQHHHYDAGHMFYTRQADLARLKADVSTWLG